MDILYRSCERLARSGRAWFESRSQQHYFRERLADQLFTSTVRADHGAAWQSHQADVVRTSIMARLLAGDILPARAIEMLDSEETENA